MGNNLGYTNDHHLLHMNLIISCSIVIEKRNHIKEMEERRSTNLKLAANTRRFVLKFVWSNNL